MLAVRDCSKTYPGALALAGIDFDISAGKVRALLGKNGAGKSTLVKILAGAVRPDRGEIRVEGEVVHLTSPQSARELGIALVNQELAIVPELSGPNILSRTLERGFGKPGLRYALRA